MKIRIGVSKDTGTKYKQTITEFTPDYVSERGFRMEDAVAFKKKKQQLCIAVADGHGSLMQCEGRHVGGRECADDTVKKAIMLSPITVSNADQSYEAIQEYHKNRMMIQFNGCGEKVKEIKVANNKSFFKLNEKVMNHGSTLSTLFIDAKKKEFHFTNIGDSAALWIKENGTEFEVLSVLHTRKSKEETNRVKKNGGMVVGDRWFDYKIENHGYSSQLSRSIGHFGNPAIIQVPHKISGKMKKKDKFIIATDGLWDYVTHKEAFDIIKEMKDPQEASKILIDLSNTRCPPKKRKDNTIVACIFVSSSQGLFGFLKF